MATGEMTSVEFTDLLTRAFPNLMNNSVTLNTREDKKVVDLVNATGRKQLIIAGLYIEICVAMPVIHAASTASPASSDPATGVIPSAPSPIRSHPRVVRLIPNTLQSRIRKL